MAHDVFISYAAAQKPLAFQLTEQLEANQVRCWIAPRDIAGGTVWVEAIMAAIRSSRLMLVLLSAEANNSHQVLREVDRAVDNGVPVLPVRIENIPLSEGLQYYLGLTHWFDAFQGPAIRRREELTQTVKTLISGGKVAETAATSGAEQALRVQPPDAGTPAAVDLDTLQVAVDPAAEPPPEHSGHYTAPMNRLRPGCFILLVDQSGSMNHRIAGTNIPKRQAVADAVNSLLYEAVLRATSGDGIRHRFDIGVLGYGVGPEGVQSAFGKDLASINEIAEMAQPPKRQVVDRPDGQGGVRQQIVDLPIWFEPLAKGQTVMYAAFERALAAAKTWTGEHPTSFPPIVINITDGGFVGKDPTPLVYEIQELCTEDGNALTFNCHISESQDEVVMYPGPEVAAGFEKRMRQLYEMSSPLPELMRERARQLRYDVAAGARGYVLNADAASLLDFLEIGGTRAMSV